MSAQIRGLLGFAMRSGKVCVGASKALEQVERQKAALVLLDEGAAPNTRDKLIHRCQGAQVPCRVLPEGLLGQAIGRPNTVAAALLHGDIARKLTQELS